MINTLHELQALIGLGILYNRHCLDESSFFGVAGVFVCLRPVGTIPLIKILEAISRVRSNICLSVRKIDVIYNYLLQIEFVVEKELVARS